MSASGGSTPQLGYCHTCDRQVSIDPVTFECSVCHGGFVEIFEIEQQQQQQQQQQQFGAGGTAGPTPRFIRLNNQNLGDVLMQLLSSAGHPPPPPPPPSGDSPGPNSDGSSRPDTNAGTRPPPPVHFIDPLAGFMQAPPGSNQQPASHHRPHGMSTARFQLILPTRNDAGHDQFDLYGVINNVIADLLDPRRAQGQAGGPNTFHFQTAPIRIINLHSDARDYAWGTGGLDAIITQLLNQLENTGPPPASTDQLKNLPVITITQEHVDTNAQCAICMEDFKIDEHVKKLPCKHLFHEPCITEWLRLHGTCPVCRKNLNGEDTSQREYISRPPTAAAAAAAADGNNAASTSQSPPSSSSRIDSNESQEPSRDSRNNPNQSRQFYDPDFD